MSKYYTKDELTMKQYHALDALGNGSLVAFQESPAKYKWLLSAPEQPGSSKASDFGTALHTAILEPENYKAEILTGPTKTRTAQAFEQFAADNPDKTVLTESEMADVEIMKGSANAHPTFSQYLSKPKDNESSIFITCNETGLARKIRIDMNFAQYGADFIGDIKTTRSIADWRSTMKWKNPLYAYNYGHTASYYLDVASQFYGREINTYIFFVVQTTIEMGKYPVEVIAITRDELERYGFWEQMTDNLHSFAECNEFAVVSQFPDFGADDNEIEIITEDDNE